MICWTLWFIKIAETLYWRHIINVVWLCVLHQDNDKLHMNLLELEVSGDPWASAEAVQECVTRALAAPLTPDTKILFSQRGLQFAEDYSNSIQRSEVNSRLTGRYRTSSVSYKPFIDFFCPSLCVCLCLSSAVCCLCTTSTRSCCRSSVEQREEQRTGERGRKNPLHVLNQAKKKQVS